MSLSIRNVSRKTRVKQRNKNRIYYTLAADQKREIDLSNDFDKVAADNFKKLLSHLVKAKRYDIPLSDRELLKINSLPLAMYEIFVKHGLIESRQNDHVPTLESFLEEYQRPLNFRSD